MTVQHLPPRGRAFWICTRRQVAILGLFPVPVIEMDRLSIDAAAALVAILLRVSELRIA